MGIKSISLAATALVLSTSVNAAIISTDWQTAGDNLITHDTVSGLNWLDLTETNNLSLNAVGTMLADGELYDGFRVATQAEVVALWSNFGIDLSSSGPSSATGVDPGIPAAAAYLGNILHEYDPLYSYGTLGYIDRFDEYHLSNAYHMGAYTNDEKSFYIQSQPGDRFSSYELIGTYLVYSVVPVPSAIWLFGTGLIGLIGVARRKARA